MLLTSLDSRGCPSPRRRYRLLGEINHPRRRDVPPGVEICSASVTGRAGYTALACCSRPVSMALLHGECEEILATGLEHAIKNRDADGGFGPLTCKGPCPKLRANNPFVSTHRGFHICSISKTTKNVLDNQIGEVESDPFSSSRLAVLARRPSLRGLPAHPRRGCRAPVSA